MKKIKKYIVDHIDKIFMSLLLSLIYLFVIGLTYAILDYNLGDSAISFLFLLSICVVETLIYLTSLVYVLKEW